MDKEMGDLKGEAWRSSNKLKTRADPMTGSESAYLLEHTVPRDWSTLSAMDLRKAAVNTSAEADEKDTEALDEASGFYGKGKTNEQAIAPAIKIEPQDGDKSIVMMTSEEQKLADIKSNRKAYLRSFQEEKTYIAELQAKLVSDKFATVLNDECMKLSPKLKNLCAIIEGLVAETAVDKHMATLARKTTNAENSFAEIKSHAERMNYMRNIKKKWWSFVGCSLACMASWLLVLRIGLLDCMTSWLLARIGLLD